MFRRLHLNALTEGQGIDFFSHNICEDHLIGDLLWKQPTPVEILQAAKETDGGSSHSWGNHALDFGDFAIQPVAGMSIFRLLLSPGALVTSEKMDSPCSNNGRAWHGMPTLYLIWRLCPHHDSFLPGPPRNTPDLDCIFHSMSGWYFSLGYGGLEICIVSSIQARQSRWTKTRLPLPNSSREEASVLGFQLGLDANCLPFQYGRGLCTEA